MPYHVISRHGVAFRRDRRLASCDVPSLLHLHLDYKRLLIMAPGERSEEVWLWYTAVYEAIQEIPHGKVTSYGHIARLVGKRALCSRMTMTTGC